MEQVLENIDEPTTSPEAPDKPIDRNLAIRARTARHWLKKLGFDWEESKKGVYIDGHERQDVVDYRDNVFLPKFFELLPKMVSWDEDGNMSIPELPNGERPVVLVTHDESAFNANDGRRRLWIKDGNQPLRPKGKGRGIMVSDFLTPDGRLAISCPDGSSSFATEYLEYGRDNYWTGDLMISQLINKAIPIFEAAFPGFQACFAFDNSSNHGMFAPDALDAAKMNLNPGGKQPKLRDGFIYSKGCSQSMVFPEDHPTFPGQAKGIRQVLIERGLWRPRLLLECKNNCTLEGDCCARAILSSEQDFKLQRGRIQEEVEGRGHICLFYPKFHCELNFIEPYWGAAKRYSRNNCDYSFDGLRKTVPASLASVPRNTIRRFYGQCLRTMEAYRSGLKYGTEEFTQRVYKSHRRIEDKDKW